MADPGGANRRAAPTRKRWFGWIAGGVSAALVVTLAVVANGFDSRETPREDPSIWVERTAGQYARVNTETAEIDTVRLAESPSGVVQTSEIGVLFTQGMGRAWQIDPRSPRDVVSDDPTSADAEDEETGDESSGENVAANSVTGSGFAAEDQAESDLDSDDSDDSDDSGDSADVGEFRTPEGTDQVIAAGNFVLFVTQGGSAYVAHVVPARAGLQAELGPLLPLDPFAEERAEMAAESQSNQDRQPAQESSDEIADYVIDAAAIDASGRVATYSSAEQAIRWYDATQARWQGSPNAVPAGAGGPDAELAILGAKWALLDPGSGELWRQDQAEPTSLDVVGIARLGESSTAQSSALVADEGGLWQVDEGGSATRLAEAQGVAAQPRFAGEDPVAAWVSSSSASMWTASAGDQSLVIDDAVEDLSNPDIEIRTNGSRALIVERTSGMMWTVPDGELIPVEQWALVDPPKQEVGTVVTQEVTEPEPPVAVDDAFGVRAGEPVSLPVLLNDYDPNRKDVLTVVPEGLGDGLSESFGQVTVLSDGQGAVVQPLPSAEGSASFTYRVTDGANTSQPATVALTVFGDEVNTAPVWCPVEGCLRGWPSPEIEPGGTLVLPVLEGWVDPEGDPIMLAGANVANPEDPIRALVSADGKLALRHSDVNAAAGESVVRLRVVDSRGAESERDLRVRIRPGAAIEFASMAMTARVSEPIAVRPLERVTGGSGSFTLTSAVTTQGSATVSANPGAGTIEVTAPEQGSSLLSVTVSDSVTGQETTGVIRVTAVDSRATLAVPPLRAFVRPLADSTIDVLASIPGANSRALTIQSATVRDGQLRADVIEHSRVRVSGSTADGQPGRIGSIDVVISEGETTAVGRITVFQVTDVMPGAIAVTDTATVRAGSVVDIPVLENDVAPPGERLMLHPEIGSPGVAGELAFASGSSVRYLAPNQPGQYTLSYTTFGASSPEQSDVGQVLINVLPTGANRAPQPATVTVLVAPGESVTSNVPLSGVDPDGDRVRLVSAESPGDGSVSVSIVSRSNALQVEAAPSAERSTQLVSYTVRDSFGGEAKGRLRIVVTDPDPGGGAPVVYSDYVRLAVDTAEPAVVRPMENDLDPSGGTLQLVSVEPNVPGGENSPLYAELAERLDTASLRDGVVQISGGDSLGTVSYKYTVRSSKSKSTADGLIVVQVSERIGQQAPQVIDTVLSVRDRADFERSGVDVVTDRVRWASGDASTLKLSLWGEAAGSYRVNGSKIVGDYRAEGDTVVFRLAGADATGAEVETYGFLLVPPLDELRLSLKPGTAAVSVAENKSVDVNIAELLDLGSGDRVELADGSFGVQRQQASCVAVNETTLRYSAGREAPWSDTCTVRVKLLEQSTFTVLPLQITIVPDDPVAQVNPMTRTIAPGAAESIALTDMLQWQGGREGRVDQLRWQVSHAASSFEIVQSGSQLQVQARADAVPGSQQALTVGVNGAGTSQAMLTLRVGEAAVDAPRGAAVSLQCTVGASCSTPLVGVSGEYDPFVGKSGGGLRLVSVDDAGCEFGTMRVAENSVSVSWADPRGPGGRCTATFTVRDAQNRTGTGAIEFDALGVPRAPASIVPTGANASDVTLTVSLSSQTAHPATTGVEILSEDGEVVASCSPAGGAATCTVADVPVGKDNGRSYFARAVNSVGPSDQTSNASQATWAYVPPATPTVTAESVRDSSRTSVTEGQMRVVVDGSNRARRFLLTIDGGERIEVSRTSTHSVAPGSHRVTVIPEDRDLPPGYSGTTEGAAGTVDVVVAAAPIVSGVELRATGDTTAALDYLVDPNYADADSVRLTFGVGRPGDATCSSSNTSGEFEGLSRFRSYAGVICATSSFGTTIVSSAPIWIGGAPAALTVDSGYSIGGPANEVGNVRTYNTVVEQPSLSGQESAGGQQATIRYQLSTGGTYTGTLPSVPVGATVQVQQCFTSDIGEQCSALTSVPATGYPASRITWNGVCVASGGDLSSVFVSEGRPISDASFTQQGDEDVRVSWSGFDDTVFAGAVCAAASPPGSGETPPSDESGGDG